MTTDGIKQLIETIKEYFSQSIAPFVKRLEEVENRKPIHVKSVFEIAQEKGFKGDEIDWLKSLKGKDGINGEDGKKGLDGKDGKDGGKGLDGKNGANGINGLSAYEIVKEKGFSGTETEWIESLKGKDGINGIAGEDGIDGINGKDGVDGKDGLNGLNGQNGKDALEIEILPAISDDKSYPRGCYACADGGVVRAYRNTDKRTDSLERSGWDVVLNGIKSININQDGRLFNIEITQTNGQIELKEFSLPVLIYQGIFKQGQTYNQGDVVTWAGSSWHCEKETDTKPGESDDWVLMVKRGRDGKDGQRGEKGDKGLDGANGGEYIHANKLGNI